VEGSLVAGCGELDFLVFGGATSKQSQEEVREHRAVGEPHPKPLVLQGQRARHYGAHLEGPGVPAGLQVVSSGKDQVCREDAQEAHRR